MEAEDGSCINSYEFGLKSPEEACEEIRDELKILGRFQTSLTRALIKTVRITMKG